MLQLPVILYINMFKCELWTGLNDNAMVWFFSQSTNSFFFIQSPILFFLLHLTIQLGLHMICGLKFCTCRSNPRWCHEILLDYLHHHILNTELLILRYLTHHLKLPHKNFSSLIQKFWMTKWTAFFYFVHFQPPYLYFLCDHPLMTVNELNNCVCLFTSTIKTSPDWTKQ